MLDENNFEEVKTRYHELRNNEWEEIRTKLEEKNFTVKRRGKAGQGSGCYGKNRYKKGIDLSFWRWIDFSNKFKNANNCDIEVHYFLSFQPFDKDPGTQNIHVLPDYLGLVVSLNEKDLNNNSYLQNNMCILKWALPLSDVNVDELTIFLNELGTHIINRNKADRWDENKKFKNSLLLK